jgi:urease accessory protein
VQPPTTIIIIMDEPPAFPWLARLLQVSDSAFPTGSYAHSYGFEQVVALGLVTDADSMQRHILAHVWPALVNFELPVVRLARAASRNRDDLALVELDTIVDATKATRELREASRATGRQRLRAFLNAAPSLALVAFAQAVNEDRAQGHHAVVFGSGMAALPLNTLLTSWAYQNVSGLCLASPKLLRIGQDAAQRVLTSVLAPMDAGIARSLQVTHDDIGWFDPLVDLASMQHEIAHERLYIS